MNNVVKIENQELQIKEYQGHRVVTLKDIDHVHERLKDTSRKAFNRNRNRFVEGEDFFSITRKDFAEKYGQNNCVPFTDANQPMRGNPNVSMVLLTESGYMMLAKVFDDDLAWKVQRQLVNCYFKVREQEPQHQASITFDQMMNVVREVRKTPQSSMHDVFRVLKIFIPELEIPEPAPKTLMGAKVVKQDRKLQEKLQEFLNENNLTISELSRETGLAKSNLHNWLNGKHTPSMPNLQLLADVIDVDINIFLKGE